MSSKFILVCEVNTDGGSVAGAIAPTGVAGNPQTAGAGAFGAIDNIAQFLVQEMLGRGINIRYADTAVSASTTGTFTGDPVAGDTVTVNGVAFTARASGAVANEYNFVAGNVTSTAAALAAAINASTTTGIINTIAATSAAGVVTFLSVVPGPVGINIPISESTSNFTVAASTFTTGGTQSHNATLSAGV